VVGQAFPEIDRRSGHHALCTLGVMLRDRDPV
jgi:hypothetical protein